MANELAEAIKPNNLQTGALTGVDPKAIIERYLEGENSAQIAQSFGITKQRLSYWMLNHAEADWQAAQIIKASELKDAATDELNVAKESRNPVDLAYARERLKAAQWDLERVCRRIYGQDAPQAGGKVTINIGVVAAHTRVDDETHIIEHP